MVAGPLLTAPFSPLVPVRLGRLGLVDGPGLGMTVRDKAENEDRDLRAKMG